MKVQIVLCVELVVLLGGCSGNETTGPNPDFSAIPMIEYSVLSSVVDSSAIPPTMRLIVLDDSTNAYAGPGRRDSALTVELGYVILHFPELTSEALGDFKSKNLERTFIDAPKRINPVCVRASETDTLWPWLQVSRVGFNSEYSQALVYVGFVYAPLAGSGDYILLSLVGGKWVVVRSLIVWVS